MEIVKQPIIVVSESEDDNLDFRFWDSSPHLQTPTQFGRLMCDTIRAIALHKGFPEAEVWNAIETERRNPTTTLRDLNKPTN